ncbi:hypothetical protein RRV45_11410 [Bacillus sp. DTU_2020_1000418_1_SI_GHA_SEK_038]|nr:hypothetical protein [Bacillus sp. DTU_2020_1000418_1_SI_GHA_SEK_038]WNS73534.1 hypothetical protein RRV45_11410 [Bacillus sp. DTU_2020_1000418_1_SI_GHA_SEK_038]
MTLTIADIDKLLDATQEMADEDDFRYIIRRVEIDKLLEKTQDW